jgi:hypothetical protein
MMIAVGIDPGVRGGIADISDNSGISTLIDAIHIPVAGSGTKESINVSALYAWLTQHKPDVAFIERAQAMPRQGASSGFKYGRNSGAARGHRRAQCDPVGNGRDGELQTILAVAARKHGTDSAAALQAGPCRASSRQ